ncbi:MAG TPA: amidohydrolase family protein [Bryobacteraceae bacterium]|nr:amidohydrolase family protein [Bryobacteraceae bacterium]
MLTRREALLGALAFAGARDGLAKASQPSVPLAFDVPPHACDCHTHIFGNPKKFYYWPSRAYTPEPALPKEMAALHRKLHIERVVIVTPSVYGPDNSATLNGMKARGPNARGVAVIDELTSERALEAMAREGIRGIRLNLATGNQIDAEGARTRLREAADRVKKHNWHIQMFTTLPVIAAIKDAVRDSPVPVVFDHFGSAQASLGVEQPGFADLIDLVRAGNTWVKISGAYRSSQQAPDYADVAPLAKALIAANADRVLWGTDWPHPNSATPAGHKPTEITPLFAIDDARLFNQFAQWAPDPALRTKILVDNPARLYGF